MLLLHQCISASEELIETLWNVNKYIQNKIKQQNEN